MEKKEKKKMGRPIVKNRNKSLQLRLSENELDIIQKCANILGTSRVDAINLAIEKLYKELKK